MELDAERVPASDVRKASDLLQAHRPGARSRIGLPGEEPIVHAGGGTATHHVRHARHHRRGRRIRYSRHLAGGGHAHRATHVLHAHRHHGHGPHGAHPANPHAPNAPASSTPTGNVDAGHSRDGHDLPATSGKATTFWNGRYSYKGRRDPDNMSKGAWGDENKPTDYIAALPVGLKGGGDWWHNQKILVTNPTNGKQVVVQVQDKGPAPRTGAAIDLSPVAKEALGVHFMDNMNVKISFADPNAPVGPVNP
jgi:hypothetical protein